MSYSAQLGLFFLMVFGVVVFPGIDMAFVLASSLVGGRRSGLFAVSGIVLGGLCHVVVGVLGISVLLQVFPAAFNALLLLGALYVAWIGLSLLRSSSLFLPATGSAAAHRPSGWASLRQGALTNLLNPKAYLFMLAIFPQFLRPERGALALQAGVLAAIIAATQAGVYGALVLLAANARGWLESRPAVSLAVGRAVGILLILAAGITGWEGWRRF
jgi:threonine/homoserine/homoserine lactone efflux protein